MKYAVMYRRQMVLRTNDIVEARQKMISIGDTAYIHYGRKGRAEYMATHESHTGENE